MKNRKFIKRGQRYTADKIIYDGILPNYKLVPVGEIIKKGDYFLAQPFQSEKSNCWIRCYGYVSQIILENLKVCRPIDN